MPIDATKFNIVINVRHCRQALILVVLLVTATSRVIHENLSNFDIVFDFFFQAEDGIRDLIVTGVQTCALPISEARDDAAAADAAYFQAYAFYFLGRFPCPNTPRKRENAVKARQLYLRAARALDPPLERVAIPFAGRPGEGSEVVVYVRKPRGVARPPVVVQWGGVDSFKEERQPIAERFLAAGFATVSIDMPGTGESPLKGSVDAERQYTPVFAWLRAQPDLDGARIVALGGSFGGY